MSVKLTEQQKMIYDDLSMPEKIAIFLIQLGEEATSLIFSHMDVDVITDISGYIATARNIDKQVAAAILEEFYALMQSNQYMRSGGLEYAKEILYRTFGAEVAQKILDKLAKSMENTKSFGYLSKIKPQQLADFIIKEHPQTIALILAHMDSTSAAETLSFFSDELRGEVVIRMANLGDISPSVIKRVSTVLEGKLESLTSYKVEVGGPRAVAEVLNRLGQKASKTTIERIEQNDQKLATTIKELMFTFEDIITLNDTAIREILKNVDKKDLMVAFKGSSEALRDKFLGNMSQRASEAFKEEMSYLGAVRVKDVEEAQRRIVEAVQALAEQGVFQVGEADEMIE
ncbi:flagellar motor switch protein FliG [Campylobacter sp. RM9344]|uniref:Flagellar motor switch protein FliG n=2 Tax=Campylobacteraceae TaxID=72294 RepID=A0AAW3ZV46_9BACT|nr:flagellar motor switch protein FliG [Campylobacter sp. RM6883]MBE2986220.1 flagellar motor switch protein FliG [Campylobacter sp. RM12919]MBE2988217.1 flagellar motor switch protein FliG [Campylobacter sp. RM12920]MBE2995526.1 flagellar motor switch protein FliG [Campylobacter sp. RM6913]MBE3022625.1 flagellar motor switch protein FliG [Campylobacter sp. 7477a]MBE3029805.1 flagellar motor switch protein FliG [Campylobacter sp. RM9344]MBE3605942.1 flagellar motor switch protein FliG [Campyl